MLRFLGGAYRLFLYVSRQHGRGEMFYNRFLPLKCRGFYLVLCQWLPLNLFILGSRLLRD